MNTRVAVAMSGGVDSSVACLLLKEKGYELVGLTMKLLPNSADQADDRSPCCTVEMAEDARRICSELGIPHYTLNLVDEFEEAVVRPFIRAYAAGRTPNPCLVCNSKMKFGHLLRKARESGADFVATGHYARAGAIVSGAFVDNTELMQVEPRETPDGRVLLLRGTDDSKDQSYALYSLTQHELSHAMFPLGKLTKREVRAIAAAAGLVTAEKPESQEICFVTGSYREFLEKHGALSRPGSIVDTAGRTIGRHDGIHNFTVGQRRGLGVTEGKPLYVVDLDVRRNQVMVGSKEDAYSSGCEVEDLNLISLSSLDVPAVGTCMVRYRGREVQATIAPVDGSHARIHFNEPQFAVTPGQAAVFYQGEQVLGGGVITSRLAAGV